MTGPAAVAFDTAEQRWRLRWGSWELCVGLVSGRLLARLDSTPSGVPRPALPVPAHLGRPLSESQAGLEVSVLEGGEQRFRLADWGQDPDGTLVIELAAVDGPLRLVSLWYVDTANSVVTHVPEVQNPSPAPVTVTGADSLALQLPGARSLTCLTGQWTRETQRCDVPATAPLLLESRSGKTGFEQAPYLAVHADGYVAALSLAWSGNWFLRAVPEPDAPRREVPLTVRGGLNPWRLRHELAGGEALRLPTVRVALAAGDLNTATQQLHQHRRDLLRRGGAPRVQFNSWYPYQQRPTLEAMRALATQASRLGCEVFVQDAGWYANRGTSPDDGDWWACVGDWATATDRFPGGMRVLGKHLRELGLEFGLWFEPEAVATTSELNRLHPEWVHATDSAGPGRRIANLGLPEVRAHLAEVVAGVLADAGATWMKWDCNLNLVGEPATDGGPDPVVAHVLGVYDLQERLRAAVGDLTLEMCAGGGGRFDDAILERAHTNWMSDQTQPLANLSIHFGSQLLHLPEECNDWLVDWPPHDTGAGLRPVDTRGDLGLRAAVASLGAFGISAPLDRWSDGDRAAVAAHVGWYKERIRPRFTTSRQYLLGVQPSLDGDGEWAGVWYVEPDGSRGHLSAFRLADGTPTWKPALAGLDPDRSYTVQELGGEPVAYRSRDLAEGALSLERDRFGAAVLDVVAEP